MINFRIFKLNFRFVIVFIALATSCFALSFCFNFVSSVKANEAIKLPIIMYHSVLKSRSGDYIVHPETLESDFKYIKEKGYTTVTITDLINYVYDDVPLPEKPIVITFDDGCYNNLGYAVPLLHKYNMKAVISIVGSYTDTYSASDETNLNYSYLRWKDINELITDGCIEFQNHTYNMHTYTNKRKGCKKASYESFEDYSIALTNDITKLQNEFNINCNGYVPNCFTYPFGSISKESEPIIKNLGFKASLSCISGVNYITKDPDCLFLLKRNNRIYNTSTQRFFNKILE